MPKQSSLKSLPPTVSQALSQDVSSELARPQQQGKFTQVPTYWLGKILDNGKASIYGIWLYVYKLSKGPGFVLNERHVGIYHRIGWRPFRNGINLLRKIGLLTRFQPARARKSRAVERLADPPGQWRGYVRIDDRLLDEPADVLAFVAAVHVSPTARRPIEIARRIGVKSEMTARALQRRAYELKAIDVRTTTREGTRVGRPGYFNSPGNEPAKFGATKNGTTKNGASYSTKEEEQYKGRQQDKENLNIHTLSGESARHESDFIPLSDWKQSDKIIEMCILDEHLDDTSGNEDWPLSKWQHWLTRFGGVPKHLEQPFAMKQAGEIARAAVSIVQDPDEHSASVNFDRAMIGIAALLCQNARKVRVIRSLAIIAIPILRSCKAGDWDWANFPPSPKLGNDLKMWRDWAEGTLLVLTAIRGHSVDSYELLSTCRLEALADLADIYGHQRIETAVTTTKTEADQIIFGWWYFEPACKALSSSSQALQHHSPKRKSLGRN